MHKILIFVVSLAICNATYALNIHTVGVEEALGQGRLSTIYTDSRDQPHVAADGGVFVYFYDKIGDTWRSSAFDVTTVGDSRQYYNPALEVVPATQCGDVLWCSGILFGSITYGVGIGTITRQAAETGPTAINYSRKRIIPTSWDTGNISTDPYTQEATVWVSGGWWQTYAYDPQVEGGSALVNAGRLYIGVGGEANNINISKARPVVHGNNGENAGKIMANWHLATCGAIGYDNCNYNSSLRYSNGQGMVPWLYPSCKRGFGDDGVYASVCGDLVDPEIAYMCTSLSETHKGGSGVWGNVFDGDKMVYPPMQGMPIDPYGGSGLRRYAPQFAPHINGGAWVVWTRAGTVMIRYIAQDGTMSPEQPVCPGSCADIASDTEGNLHLSYQYGGIKYRKLIPQDTATVKRYPYMFGDYDGDGRSDMCGFNRRNGLWICKSFPEGAIVKRATRGGLLSTPAPYDYDGDGIVDVAVYEPNGLWRIEYSKTGNVQDLSINACPVGIPVPGNYLYAYTPDGTPYLGMAELAVYDQPNGMWYIRNNTTGQRRVIEFGGKYAIPIPADFDGDGRTDPAVYFYKTSTWAIYDWGTKQIKSYGPIQFGGAGFTPFAADLDNNGTANICGYKRSTGEWYSLVTEQLPQRVQVDGYPVKSGGPALVPIPGNYTGNGITRALYNPETMRFFSDGTNIDIGGTAWLNPSCR